jgi:hypothetical protein
MLPPNTSLYNLVEDAWGITVLLPTTNLHICLSPKFSVTLHPTTTLQHYDEN